LSFDRLRDLTSGSVYSPVFGNVAEVQTDGAYAVHFRLKPPDPFFSASLPGNIWTLHFNLTRKPFDNLKVRQAFMYGIDREKIGKSQTPPTPKRWGMLPEPFPGALTAQTTPMELRYDYDPDKAKAQLRKPGSPPALPSAISPASATTICR
jgi:ABC-type oligopeptide transport system substrate-binding subunit